MTVNAGEKVSLYLNSNAHPDFRSQPVYAVTPTERDVIVTVKEKKGRGGRKVLADNDFKHTSAHEFGHLILNGYGGGWPVPNHSWSHKGSSTVVTQTPLEKHPIPKSGEIDLMEYHSDHPTNVLDYWDRSAAHEQDVKGLIWLTRTEFND